MARDDAQTEKYRDYFSKILETKIMRDPMLLSHQYIPDRLIARDNEIARVMDLFGSMVKFSCSATNAVIIGTAGCGKTVVVKFVLNLIDDMLRERESDVQICPIYIQCRHAQTQQRILYQISEMLDPTLNLPKNGIPLSDYIDAIVDTMQSTNTSVILVLDEINLMKGDQVLYMFSRPREYGLTNDRIYTGIIGITNDPQYYESLPPPVKSSLLAQEVVFPPYHSSNLVEILTDRIGAFHEGKLDEMVIPLCAALSAQDRGDARRAIDLLYKSGMIAEQEGADMVVERHVREAVEAIEADSTTELVKQLPPHSQAVLYALAIIKMITHEQYTRISELYAMYSELSGWIGLEALTMRRVRDILDEHEMLRIVDVRVSHLGRYGRTKEVTLMIKAEHLAAALRPMIDPDKVLDIAELYRRVFGGSGAHQRKLIRSD